MNEQFKYLFLPLEVGHTTLKNRIMMTAHDSAMQENNLIGDRYVEYLRARAKGGVGSFVLGIQSVHPTSTVHNVTIFACDEKIIPGYKKAAEAVHEYDAKIFSQLWHAGRQNLSDSSRRPILAPSPIPCPVCQEMPKAMEIEEINEIVQGYVRAARHAREGGFDGVELHAASGYLIEQFLSPWSNKRTDEYGGSLDNRMRFLLQVLDAVRREVGNDFVVGIRIPGDEFIPGGLNLDDFKEIAQRLEDTKKIDYISISPIPPYASNYSPFVQSLRGILGSHVYQAAALKEVVQNIPIIANNRIKDPIQAEKILADSQADIIGMVRALIADPDFVNKAQDGRLDDIRPCVNCNLGCYARQRSLLHVSCVQNPPVGLERELGTLHPAQTRKKVVIIGGGPAGMEAARVARLRGHQVALYEKENELGGQINIAARVESRKELGDIIRYLANQIEKLGVEIHLGTEADPVMVQSQDPDAVILATGSVPVTPPIPGADQQNVVNVCQVLKEEVPIGENVVFVDDDGHHLAMNTVEFLVNQGKKVEVVTRFLFVGPGVLSTVKLPQIYQELLSKGVKFTPNVMLTQISGSTVTCFNVYSRTEVKIEGVDTIVLAMGKAADDRLYQSLKDRVKELYRIGDCVAPRKIIDAIYEGYNLGRNL